MKDSPIIIQADVPICPVCNAALKLNKIIQKYICNDCKNQFIIVDTGNNDREFICKNMKEV